MKFEVIPEVWTGNIPTIIQGNSLPCLGNTLSEWPKTGMTIRVMFFWGAAHLLDYSNRQCLQSLPQLQWATPPKVHLLRRAYHILHVKLHLNFYFWRTQLVPVGTRSGPRIQTMDVTTVHILEDMKADSFEWEPGGIFSIASLGYSTSNLWFGP